MKARITTIVAVTALVVAVLGATPVGHAAANMILPKNSVGTTQLKAAAVTGAKIKNGTLTAAKFKAGQLPAGLQGPKGDAGPQGPQGPSGPAGVSGLVTVTGPTVTMTAGQTVAADATCPAGTKALAGGWDTQSGIFIRISRPLPGNAGWQVVSQNDTPYPFPIFAYAVCAAVS